MNTPDYYEPRAPRPHIDASRIRRRPRSRRRPLPAGLPLTKQREFSPPRPLRNGQVQTMIGNLPFMQWLTRRRGLALLANSQEWLLDCGDGVRLQGFLTLTRGFGGAKKMTVVPAEK